MKIRSTIARRLARVLGFSFLAAWLQLIATGAAAAATFVPTTFNDPPISGAGISVNTATGVISGGSGNGLISLRSAVQAANANSGSTINLGVGTYHLTIAPVMSGTSGSGNFHKAAYDNGTGLNTNGSLDITAAVTINGVSAAQTIIDGGGPNANEASPTHDLLMSINPYIVSLDQAAAPNSFATTLSNLTLQHGDNPSDDGTLGFSAGGAIYWEAGWNHMALGTGSLTLNSVSILHNKARGAGAGMVLWNGGTVTINNSTISNNTVDGAGVGGADGGGIIATQPAPSGVVNITNTTFDSNSCIPKPGAGGGGGAIEVVGAAQTYAVTIHGGSITNNSAPAGAGILGASGPLNITIDQGTLITGNTATAGPGGGIFVPAAITVKAGTVISGNSATAQGGGAVVGAGSTITQSSVVNNSAGIAGGGVYVYNGPDASTGMAAVNLPFDRVFGNTAPAGGSQVDSANDLTGFNDVWLGSNVPPASTGIGASNAVAISSIGPDAYHSTTVPATTATHNAFATGQGLEISGVATGAYDGFAGCYSPPWATPPSSFAGITVTGTTTFTMCSHLANPGATNPASSGGQANQSAQIIGASESGTTVTITVTQGNAFGVDMPHEFVVGQVVRIQGITASNAFGYNGEFVVTSVPSTPTHPGTTFTYTAAASGLPTLATGTTQYGVAIPLVNNNISTATESGATVTLTLNDTVAHYGFALGNLVSIAGVGGQNSGGYNGSAVITAASGSTVAFTSPNTGLASASNGNITKLADSILQFKLTASPNLIRIGDTSTLTASFLSDSANNVISPSNLGLVIGLPVTWAPGSLGTLSGQQATVQNSGTATATFTSNAGGLDTATALVDNPPAGSALITILFPPSIAKAFNATHIPVGGVSTLTFTITNPNTTHGLAGLAFSDSLPAGLAVASSPNTSTTCGGTVSAAANATSMSFSGGSMSFNAAGTLTCSVTVDVKGVADGVQNNTSGHVSATDLGGMTGNTASASITVINPPTINKVFGASTIPLNGTTSLTFTLTNPNSNAASVLNGISFTDTLPNAAPGTLVVATPNGLTNTCSTTPTATAGSGSISLTGASLAAGASCTISVNVQGVVAGSAPNSVTVGDTVAGTGNTSSTSLVVVAPPTISKSFSPKSIPLNGNSTLSFTLTNPNTASALSGVAFSDSLPGGIKLASTTVTGSCGSGTITATINNPPGSPSTVSLSGGTLTASPAAGSSCTFSVTVTGISAGAQVNTTSAVSSTEGGTGGTASDTLTVVAPPTISKSFSPKTIPLNSNSTLSFTVTNPNTASALSGVAFTDSLPGGVKLASTTVTSSCGAGTITASINNPPGSPSTVSLSGGTLTASPASGSSCTFSVSVTGISAGAQVNTTSPVSSAQGGTGGTASDTLTVVAPPTISKSFSPKTITLNSNSTLSFTVTNPSTVSASSGVAFTDSLPTGVKLASTTVTGSCGTGTITATINNPPGSPSTVSLSGGTLTASPDPASSCTFSVGVTGISAGAQVNTTSTVSSTEGGTGATASDTLTVIAPPTISKQFGHTTVPLNQSDTLSFTLTNPNTTSALSGVSFTDTLPGGIKLASTTVTGSCGSGTITATINNPPGSPSTVSLSGGTLAASPGAGSSCTFSVGITGISAGAQVNTTSTVSSTEGGTGGTATDTTTVVTAPTTNEVFNPTTITVGGTSTMTITITNPSATVGLTGVGFTDTFPANLVVATPNGLSNTCNGTPAATAGSGTLSLTGGTIAANSSCAVTVNVTSSIPGNYLNSTGPISSTEGGTGVAATATLTVAGPPTISKSFSPKTIPLNSNSTLSFTLTNPNTASALSGVAFTDSFPGGVKLASTTVTGSCGSGTITATINNPPGSPSTISLSGGTLAASGSCNFSVSVTGISVGAQVNTTSAVSSTEGGTGGTATDTLTVVAAPTISKSFSPKTIPLNSNSTLSFTVTNPNTASALSGVAFTDSLPGGVKLASTTVTGSCGSGTIAATINNPPGSPSTVSLSGGTLTASPDPASSCTFSVSVTGISAGAQVNTTSTVSSIEGGTGGTASDTLTVIAPPTISKTFSPKTVQLNSNSTLSFTLTNPNTVSALSGVAFTDSLPGGATLASTTVTGSCGTGTLTATINNPPGSPSTVSLSGGTLTASPDPASSCTFSVSVTGTSAGPQVNTTGNVSSTEGGTGGTASDTLNVMATSAVTLSTPCMTTFVESQSTLLDATVTGFNPSGTVAFTNNRTLLCSQVLVSGQASCSTSDLAAGDYMVIATYEGDTFNTTARSLILPLTVLSFADVIYRDGFEAGIVGCPVE